MTTAFPPGAPKCATADRALAGGMLKPEFAEALLGVLADGAEGGKR